MIAPYHPPYEDFMRKHSSRFAERITTQLADHGVLSFNGLMVATAAPNNQILSRNLRRLRRDGRISRTVLPTSPPRVLYALEDPSTK
jgi:DNA-binding HxlR family transcriptional regulator